MVEGNSINYDVSRYPILSSFIADWDHKVVGIRGPLGSGKSVSCVIKILSAALQMPRDKTGKRRSKWLVVRNSYRELEDTTIKTWLEWVPEHKFGVFKRQAKIHEVRFGDVELDVIFRSLDSDDDIRKVLSLEITGAWFNEAREISWTIIKNTRPRCGRFPIQKSIPYENWRIPPTKFDEFGEPLDGEAYWHGVIMDTNSPDTDHWWFKFAETPEEMCKNSQGEVDYKLLEELNRQFKFYAQPSGLDPNAENRHNLPANYYTDMILGAEEDWVKVYVHNQYGFIIDGKPVFPEYKDQVHCPGSVDKTRDIKAVPGLIIVRAWDFGLTPACTFHQFTAKGQWLVIDELGSDDSGIDRFSDLVFAYSRTHYPNFNFIDVGDPAGMARSQTDERTCFDIINKKLETLYGPNFTPIESGVQNLQLRLESVKKALNTMIDGYPGFLISTKAKETRKGLLGGYQYRKVKGSNSRYTPKPDKNKYSHYLDSVQYAGTLFLGSTLTDYEYFQDETDEVIEELNCRGRSRIAGY